MDVTVDNFSEARRLITQELLPHTQYVAFDLEFTGLRFQKFAWDHINSMPFQKYKNLRYVAETFQILQIGLSFVVFDNDKGLKIYPFNFYVFPRTPRASDINLTIQLGCLKFNSSNGMDWNKWINKGVNYVKVSEMKEMQEQSKGKTVMSMIESLSPDWQDIAKRFIRVIRVTNQENEGLEHHFSLDKYRTINKYLKNLFYKCLEEDQQLSLSFTEEEEGIVIKKVSQKQKEKQVKKQEEELYGFALLFDQIWKKGLPFIGHNCMLDIMYIYQHFLAPLPENYYEFKDSLTANKNSFFDTKYIGMKYPELIQYGSRLEDLVKHLRSMDKVKKMKEMVLVNPFDRYSLNKQALHEAGYDSYITAWVYSKVMKLHDELDEDCRNKVNINFSFFFIDLNCKEDETNPYFAENIFRVNVPIQDPREDVRGKRMDIVNLVRRGLQLTEGSFGIHEGFREIFIEVKDGRDKVIKGIFELMGKGLIEVTTFGGYLAGQKERIVREYNKYGDRPGYNKPFGKKDEGQMKWAKK